MSWCRRRLSNLATDVRIRLARLLRLAHAALLREALETVARIRAGYCRRTVVRWVRWMTHAWHQSSSASVSLDTWSSSGSQSHSGTAARRRTHPRPWRAAKRINHKFASEIQTYIISGLADTLRHVLAIFVLQHDTQRIRSTVELLDVLGAAQVVRQALLLLLITREAVRAVAGVRGVQVRAVLRAVTRARVRTGDALVVVCR